MNYTEKDDSQKIMVIGALQILYIVKHWYNINDRLRKLVNSQI